MKRLKNIFGLMAFTFFLLGGAAFLFFDKGELVLLINRNYDPTIGLIMKYWTFLGDGVLLIPLLIGALFYRCYYGISVVLLSLLILLFSQGLKRTFFDGWPRPTAYFDSSVDWNTTEGVKINTTNTFPSGHTMTGFGIFFFIALMADRKWVYGLTFILAAGVGLSRIYLLQHFYVDVYFGALLGMLSALLAIYLPEYIFRPHLVTRLKSTSPLRK